MRKIEFSWLFPVLALVIVLIFPVGMMVFGTSRPGANEMPAQLPGEMTDDVLHRTADWFDDHFFLRQELITAYHLWNARFFHVSASEDVLLGADGWLFYGGDFPEDVFTAREAYSVANNLNLLRSACEAAGAEFRFLCVPNKSTVYPERLPGKSVNSLKLPYEQLKDWELSPGTLLSKLSDAEEQMYFAHDSHWNSRGAALAADMLLESLGRTPEVKNFTRTVSHRGDLYAMVYPAFADEECDWQQDREPGFSLQEDSGTRPDSIRIHTAGTGSGKLLMYRDSFGELLYPYLAEAFEEALFSRSADYRIDAMDADVVVVELVERNLRNLIRNVPTVPAVVSDLIRDYSAGEPMILTAEPSGLEGYRLWRGEAPNCDWNSPVYLLADGDAYGCFLLEEGGFAAILPETLAIDGAVWYDSGVPEYHRITR